MAALNPFCQAKRVVIKIGSALLVNSDTGALNSAWLTSLCSDIKGLLDQGISVSIVSSGAIALGRTRLGLSGPNLSLSQKQACAAAGQSLLTQAYEAGLTRHQIKAAQILLTLNDTENRRRWLNARATLEELIDLGVIPIINENDTVATDEIRYGDNDRLAARAAQMIGADTLILLSDIDGLYTSDPRASGNAEHLDIIEQITPEIMAMGGQANQYAGIGSGGMTTKLAAAQIATRAGCYMCVMDGTQNAPVSRLLSGEKSTWFKANLNPKDARRQWIAGNLKATGKLMIDTGAVEALKNGKSLLAAGVKSIEGIFEKGDAVGIVESNGTELARGLVNYSHADVQKILGKQSSEISSILGYDNGPALIHRDNMSMI